MKKGKQNFKILTKSQANEVKGGSWFSSILGTVSTTLNGVTSQIGSGAGNGGGGCPPPEPD